MALTNLTRVKANTIGSANVATITELLDATHAINTKNKYEGKVVRVSDNSKLASAAGALDTDLWQYADGTAVS